MPRAARIFAIRDVTMSSAVRSAERPPEGGDGFVATAAATAGATVAPGVSIFTRSASSSSSSSSSSGIFTVTPFLCTLVATCRASGRPTDEAIPMAVASATQRSGGISRRVMDRRVGRSLHAIRRIVSGTTMPKRSLCACASRGGIARRAARASRSAASTPSLDRAAYSAVLFSPALGGSIAPA